MFPATGPFRRELYTKHLEFFAAGAVHKERLFMAGNRVGKTTAGAYETTLHLTGLYPDWWPGRRFACPTDIWAAGDKAKTVRDIIQAELLGPATERGTGMIPGDLILDMSTARGVADAVDVVVVQHVTGRPAVLGFKTYSEGRENFQGTSKHVIWYDEEPPADVYTEGLMRTMIVPGDADGGIALITFTPLNGWTEVVESFVAPREDKAHNGPQRL
jgi:phage terminase large subunit-like protein